MARAFSCNSGTPERVGHPRAGAAPGARVPRWLSLGLIAVWLVAPNWLGALAVSLTNQDIERALKLGRSSERERALFHTRYILPQQHSTVHQFEVITEFRRYVMKTEERGRLGDWMFSQGVRAAQEALRSWQGRVSVTAQLQFDPQNTYVSVPPFVLFVGGRPEAAPVEGHIAPLWSQSLPARNRQSTHLVGATIQVDFDAAALGQAERPVSVILDGRELARVTIDFAVLE